MHLFTNALLAKSLLTILDSDPLPGESVLCINPYSDRVVVYLDADVGYKEIASYRYQALAITYWGAAATALWQFVNTNHFVRYHDNLLGNLALDIGDYPAPLAESLPCKTTLLGADADGNLCLIETTGNNKPHWGELDEEIVKQFKLLLQRQQRIEDLLSRSALTTGRIAEQTLAELLDYAHTTESYLNDSVAFELEFQVKARDKLNPALQNNREALIPLIGMHVFQDKESVKQVCTAHFRPFQLAGIWVILPTAKHQELLHVLLAFDDARLEGARDYLPHSERCTTQACLTFGLHRLQLANSYLPWVLDKGQPRGEDNRIRFIALPEIVTKLINFVK